MFNTSKSPSVHVFIQYSVSLQFGYDIFHLLQGFSLVKDGLVIIHLVAPTDHLEKAEMFYQVNLHNYSTFAVVVCFELI